MTSVLSVLSARQRTAPAVRKSPLKPNKCLMTSKSLVRALASPSLPQLKHPEHKLPLKGPVSAINSASPVNQSLSSSGSALFPLPSPSVSTDSPASNEEVSASSETRPPSLS